MGMGFPRLRARRGDVGIAPYETTTEKPCVESEHWAASQREAALLCLPSPSSLRSATSPKGRGKGRGLRIPTPVASVTGSE